MINRNTIIYFVGILLFQYILQYAIGALFNDNLFMYFLGEIIFTIIISYLFAILNYRGYRREMWRDPNFHKTFGIYFLIFFIFDLLWFFL